MFTWNTDFQLLKPNDDIGTFVGRLLEWYHGIDLLTQVHEWIALFKKTGQSDNSKSNVV